MFVGIGVGVGRQRFAPNYIKTLMKEYIKRVTLDGGIVESIKCFGDFAKLLGAYKPPVSIAATSIQATSFVANWKQYTGAKYYLLDVSLTDTFSSYVAQVKVDAPTTSYLVTGLTPNTTYYYRVRASTDDYVFAYVNWEDNYENWNGITTTWNY